MTDKPALFKQFWPIIDSCRHRTVLVRCALPFFLLIIYEGTLLALLPHNTFMTLGGLMIVYILPPAGKESVIPLGITIGIPWWLLVLSAALFDILSALFMVLNFDFLLKMPVCGGWMAESMQRGRLFVERHPWIGKMSYLGLILFVMIPMQGSGGIGSSLLGRMLGLTRGGILAAIGLGTSFSCLLIAFCSEYASTRLREYPIGGSHLIAVLTVVIVCVLVVAVKRMRVGTGQRGDR